jgi:hypothetical protein
MGHHDATTATGSAASAENHAARPHPEYVVLDVGGAYGALIIHADAELHGVEIEISLDGEDEHRSHKQVLERTINGSPAYSAVFETLEQGRYTLWTDGVPRARGVAIIGGEVATVDWTTVAGNFTAAQPGQPKR